MIDNRLRANKHSTLYHTILALNAMLDKIEELETELGVSLSEADKKMLESDFNILNEVAMQRIQSTKSVRYKFFMSVFSRTEKYYFQLLKEKAKQHKTVFF